MRNGLHKLLAIVLPAALVWVFMACLLVCENDCKDAHDFEGSSWSVLVQNATPCDECEIPSFRAAVSTRRSVIDTQLITGRELSCDLFNVSLTFAAVLFPDSRHKPTPASLVDHQRPLRI